MHSIAEISPQARLVNVCSGPHAGQMHVDAFPANISGWIAAPQKWQNRALLLTRAKQWGQTVSKSRSCSEKSAPQYAHFSDPSDRGAPQWAQHTTAASCPSGACTVSTSRNGSENACRSPAPMRHTADYISDKPPTHA